MAGHRITQLLLKVKREILVAWPITLCEYVCKCSSRSYVKYDKTDLRLNYPRLSIGAVQVAMRLVSSDTESLMLLRCPTVKSVYQNLH